MTIHDPRFVVRHRGDAWYAYVVRRMPVSTETFLIGKGTTPLEAKRVAVAALRRWSDDLEQRSEFDEVH